MLTQQRCKEPSAYSGRQQHLFSHWYDTDGERTVKTSGENEAIYVNSEFSGGNTGTARFSLYVSPYLVAGQGGKYTKHIYIGSQRIVSKLGDLASYGADPRRIPYAGNEADGLTINYKDKYAKQLQSIKDNYKAFDLPYNGEDNDDYVNGQGFCCNDATPEAAQARTMNASTRSAVDNNFHDKDNYEKMQFYYHPDHLGSSSYITNLDGEVSQHIEYVPFGEVFIEERNNTWNTPYLFNAKEFDEETGMYYYGARYYEPRISIWMSIDPMQEKTPNYSSYCYTLNNPIIFIDFYGLETSSPGDVYSSDGRYLRNDGKNDSKVYVVPISKIVIKGGTKKWAIKDQKEVKGMTTEELNLRASLSTLKQTEAGRKNNPLDYNTWNNGDNFTNKSYAESPENYKTHPGTNPKSGGSAAGAYQFLKRFYKEADFSPQNQDKAAVKNMTSSSYSAALSGNMKDFKETTKARWVSLEHWTVGQLNNVFLKYRAMELSGHSKIATPIGNLLRKKMMKIIICLLLVFTCITCNKGIITLTDNTRGTNKKQPYYSESDSIFINKTGKYALIVKSEYSKDTLDILDYHEDPYSTPIILKQVLVFTANDTILKEYKLPIANTKKRTVNGIFLNVLQTPIYEIGIVNSKKSIYYAIWGSDYCNGPDCLEFIGIYNYKGDIIFEGITNSNKERFKKILCKYKIDINKRLDTKEIDIKGNAQN